MSLARWAVNRQQIDQFSTIWQHGRVGLVSVWLKGICNCLQVSGVLTCTEELLTYRKMKKGQAIRFFQLNVKMVNLSGALRLSSEDYRRWHCKQPLDHFTQQLQQPGIPETALLHLSHITQKLPSDAKITSYCLSLACCGDCSWHHHSNGSFKDHMDLRWEKPSTTNNHTFCLCRDANFNGIRNWKWWSLIYSQRNVWSYYCLSLEISISYQFLHFTKDVQPFNMLKNLNCLFQKQK